MPVYLYICPLCQQQCEELQNFNDPPPHCDSCGALMVRQMSSPSVIFKGNGFHCTDYSRHKRRSGL
ncbi:MAG: FmdB family transcriptional regulator [Calditrichae bacterium]|nr:FmdB family transcriptional regulator [Calditrichia bacterium]